MARTSLVWRYGAWILALELVVGAVVALEARAGAMAGRRDAAATAAASLADAVSGELAPLVADTAALRASVVAARPASGMRLIVVGPDGRVLADSHGRDVGDVLPGGLAEIRDARSIGRGRANRFAGLYGVHAEHAAVRLDDAGTVLRVTAPVTLVPARFGAAWTAGIATVLAMVVTASLLAALRARLIGVAGALGRRIETMVRAEPDAQPLALPDIFLPVERSIRETRRELHRRMGALNVRRQEAETILGSMADGVVALDDQQVILSLNPAAQRLLGVRQREVKGRLLQEVTLEPALNAFVKRALSSRAEETAELEFSGDPPSHVQVMASPLDIVAGGDRRGVLLVLTDVTRLRRLERIRSDFASNVSHELRTPITNIKGYVETLIQTGLEDREQAEEFLSIIHRNSARLGAIIDDIMALTRIEQSESVGAVELKTASVVEVLEAAREELAPEAASKGTTIEIDAPRDLSARISPDLIEQAVANLLSNAVRYSRPGTHVLVRGSAVALDSGEPGLRIDVRDEGPGIAPEHLPRLFERFYRVDKARSRGVGGTGLGLAIVKHIATAHGGAVEVESEPGRGSTFSIVVPLGVSAARRPSARNGAGVSSAEGLG